MTETVEQTIKRLEAEAELIFQIDGYTEDYLSKKRQIKELSENIS